MRWLKTLVIGMGAVIVIGLTVVIVEVAKRAGEPSQPTVQGLTPPAPPVIGASAPVSVTAPTSILGDISIAIPPGATAEEIETDKARVVVRLRLSDGRTALLLIDAATGAKLGMITLDNRPKRTTPDIGKN